MNHIQVNSDLKVSAISQKPKHQTVTVQSGAKWMDILQATFPSLVVGPYDSSLGMGWQSYYSTLTIQVLF